MYVQGYLMAVAENKKDAYAALAESATSMFKDFGGLELLEGWEVSIKPEMRERLAAAVEAGPEDALVFSWVVWPDQATAEAAEQKMKDGDSSCGEPGGEMPFDMRKVLYGGFEPLVTMGR